MNLELRWQENIWTSCLHAAQIVAQNRDTERSEKLTAALKAPVERLLGELNTAAVPLNLFWRIALPLSAQIEGKTELARVILRKTLGLDGSESGKASYLGGVLSDLANAYHQAIPSAQQELSLRRRPLQEAWEARGPGLLTLLQRALPEEFIPDKADVILVLPTSGGRGTAHLDYNSVRIEAVLYDPQPELPEVVRLGWLLAQLNLDLPKYSENFSRDRLPLIARLATLPGILYAAEEVELIRSGTISTAKALELWQVSRTGHQALADIVDQWWQVQETRQSPWHIALTALDRMLET
ncbi:hypothetical protein GC197_10575 [bacterium]|nr:hypothetical protein [bacterium]